MAPVVGALIAQLHNRLADNGAEEVGSAVGGVKFAAALHVHAAGACIGRTHRKPCASAGRSRLRISESLEHILRDDAGAECGRLASGCVGIHEPGCQLPHECV